MATNQRARQSRPAVRDQHERPADEFEMSMFGRVWQTFDWMYPIFVWVGTFVISAVVYGLQSVGRIPHGGGGFYLGFTAMTLVGLLAGLMLGAGAGTCNSVRAWSLLVPLAAGVWVTWVGAYGLKRGGLIAAFSWLICTVMTTVSYRVVRNAQRDFELKLIYAQQDRAHRMVAEQTRHLLEQMPDEQEELVDPDKARWEAWTTEADLPGMTFHKRGMLPNASGLVLLYSLPARGITFAAVQAAAERLELGLARNFRHLFDDNTVPPGCVRVERAKNAKGREIVGEVIISIDVVDILAQTLRMPTGKDMNTELSITEAFQVGCFVDGTPIFLKVHEIHTLIVGLTQHGKSNLLHIMIRQLARCTDCLLWGMDFKGGDTLRLWLNPYMDGELDPHTGKALARAIFDWVAVDDHLEAERMFMATIEAATRRPAIRGGGGWIPSKRWPAIILITDELSRVVGQGVTGVPGGMSPFHVGTDRLAALQAETLKLGTGQGVYTIGATQRGTVDQTGGGTAKSQQQGRILLPVKEGATDVLQGSDPEAIRLAKSLVHKGSVIIEGFGYSSAKKGKIWLAGDKHEIREIIHGWVLELTHLRADVRLDPETEKFLLKFGYATRPMGPTPDPDRMAWYYGQDPKRRLIRWNYSYVPGSTMPVETQGAGSMSGAGAPTSLAESLGLAKVPSVMAAAAPEAAVAPAPADPGAAPPPITGRGREAKAAQNEWEARMRQRFAEMGCDEEGRPLQEPPVEPPADDAAVPQAYEPPAEPVADGDDPPTLPNMPTSQPAPANMPPPDPAPFDPRQLIPGGVGQPSTYENTKVLLVYLIQRAGRQGVLGARLHDQLEELGHAPNRATSYSYIKRLIAETAREADPNMRIIKVGQIFMTEANKPMPTTIPPATAA